jgi:hypothetical protein
MVTPNDPGERRSPSDRPARSEFAARAEALHSQIMRLCEGHVLDSAVPALVASVAFILGFVARDAADVEALTETFSGDMRRRIADNWTYLRERRAEAERSGRE